MNSKSRYFFIIFFSILTLLFTGLLYLNKYKGFKEDIDIKNSFVNITKLPDLTISNEAMFIRHRTLSDTFSVFKDSPELREYFPTTFVYSNSHLLHKSPSKILNEK